MPIACGLAVLAMLCGPIFPGLPPAATPPRELISLGGGHPGRIALSESGLWATVYGGRGRNRVVGIDPATRRVFARVPVSGGPFHIAARGRAVWVTGNFTRRDDVLYRLDPAAERVAATISLPGRYAGPVAAGRRSVWVLASNHGVTRQWLVRIDAETGQIARSLRLPSANVTSLAVDGRYVWLLALRTGRIGELPGDVLRFDPRASRVTARVDADALTLGVGPGGVWVTGCVECGQHRGTYFAQRVDTRRNRLAGPRIAVRGVSFGPLFAGRDRVWFGGYQRSARTIAFSLDPESGRIVRFLRVSPFVNAGMALDPDRRRLWVARAPGGILHVDLADG